MDNLEDLKKWIKSEQEFDLNFEQRSNKALIVNDFIDELDDILMNLEDFTKGENSDFITKLRKLLT